MEGSAGPAPDGPPVLVDQLVVEAAHQDEVVQVRAPSALPPHAMVGLGEPAGPAGGERALAVVPMAELAEHPLGRLPRHPPDPHRPARGVLGHHLDPREAQQAADGVGVNDPVHAVDP